MAKAFKCDRCGKFYIFKEESERRYFIEDGESYRTILDLCPDCYLKFINFLNGNWRGIDHQEMVGTGEFESRHYEFEDCDNIKGERVIRCREEEDGSSDT